MYLENSRRSGGGPVANVDYNRETGLAWVTFQDGPGESFLWNFVISCVITCYKMFNM